MCEDQFKNSIARINHARQIRKIIGYVHEAIKNNETVVTCPCCGDKKVTFSLNPDGSLNSAHCPNKCLDGCLFH